MQTYVGKAKAIPDLVKKAIGRYEKVGLKKRGEVIDHIAKYTFITFPSELYEDF
ncbi:MAG: hypothetical protein GY774_05420 [Planctomycetes bacterium]|nr:hypothetical protein [Planctomycetota bacterium]